MESGWERRGDCFAVSGRIGFDTAVALREAGDAAIEAAEGSLCIDFSAVESCNTVALSLLLCWLRKARRHGVALKFRHIPDTLLRIARLAELDALLGLDKAADKPAAGARWT